MEKTKTFEELIVWQKAHAFVLMIYRCTEKFPKHEIFGLTSQFRRASVSIAANIAEGYKKKDVKNKLNFLNIAHSSLEECRYYIILSTDLGYQNEPLLIEQIEEVSKLLTAYAKSITRNSQPSSSLPPDS
ncbi:MAG TPA: four helix bundle protein [Flavisolibacter sp.]|jgi:four helix bundle protein|nr:four helix bundle protein [Flavisolibacter sp.]